MCTIALVSPSPAPHPYASAHACAVSVQTHTRRMPAVAAKRRRKHAEDRALEILRQNRAVTDTDLVEVLARWRFRTNKTRQNVLPEAKSRSSPTLSEWLWTEPFFPSTGTLHGCTETAIALDLRSHVPSAISVEGDCCISQMMMGAHSWTSLGSRMLFRSIRVPGSCSAMATGPTRLKPFEG